VYHWRNALVIWAGFVLAGVAYWWSQQYAPPQVHDLAGVTLLIATGAAMATAFFILLRGSGEL
jgi:hypothetical protein